MHFSLISLYVIALRVVGIVFQALIIVLLANTIPMAEVGIFSAIYVFWGLARGLGPMGFDQVSMRDIATFSSDADNTRVQSISNFAMLAVMAGGALVAACTALFFRLAVDTGTGPISPLVVAATSLAAPAYMMNGLLSAQLRGFGRPLQSQFPEAVGLHALSLSILSLLAWHGKLSLEITVVVHAISAWLVTGLQAVLRFRCGVDLAARLSGTARRETVRDAFQIWQALVVRGTAERVPAYLSLFLLGPAATAILDVARRFGILPSLFTEGVSTTFTPMFAKLHAGSDREAYRQLLAQSSWLAFTPALAAFIFLFLFGRMVLDLFFPPSYQDAYWPMLLICAGVTVNAAFSLAGNNFLVTQRQTLVRRYFTYSFVVMVTGCIVLGYAFGTIGMAAAICASIVVCDGGLALRLAREMGRPVMLDPHYASLALVRLPGMLRTWFAR